MEKIKNPRTTRNVKLYLTKLIINTSSVSLNGWAIISQGPKGPVSYFVYQSFIHIDSKGFFSKTWEYLESFSWLILQKWLPLLKIKKMSKTFLDPLANWKQTFVGIREINSITQKMLVNSFQIFTSEIIVLNAALLVEWSLGACLSKFFLGTLQNS